MFTSELIELNDILARYDAMLEDVPVSLINYALMESRMELVDEFFRKGRVFLPNNSYLGWVNRKFIDVAASDAEVYLDICKGLYEDLRSTNPICAYRWKQSWPDIFVSVDDAEDE